MLVAVILVVIIGMLIAIQMMGMEQFNIGWDEDIDLNAAVGALAPLLGQDSLRTRSGDQLIPDSDIYVKRIRVMDETVGGAGGYLTIGGVPRNIYFGKATANQFPTIEFFGNNGLGLKIPRKTTLDCVGNSSGSGAEQHVVLLSCYSPAVPEVERVPLTMVKETFLFGVKTGTLVAATFGAGTQTIIDNLEDSEESFSIESEKEYVLIGIINAPSAAGYGVVGFRHQNKIVDRAWPAALAAGHPSKLYYVDEENPIPSFGYKFTGGSIPFAMGAGVGTTSIELGFLIGTL